MKNIIEVNNVSFEYITDENTIKAIDNLDLQVKEGEFVAIIGHNGSGKSTLSKNLNAILFPTEGNILINKMDTREEDKLWDIRQTAGMVFQNPDNQIVATVVEEDVAFGPENLGIEPNEIRKRVEESLKSVGMYELRDRQPHLLSGGQKQRVAIAGIIAMKPKCIIFDEATAMLDPSGRKEVYPGIVETENTAYFIHPIFTTYQNWAPAWYKKILRNELDRMLPNPLIQHNGPSTTQVTVLDQEQENRRIVHVLHYVPVKKCKNLEIVDDIIPLYNLKITMTEEREVEKIYTIPDKQEVPFVQDGKKLEFTLKEIKGHQMTAVCYKN